MKIHNSKRFHFLIEQAQSTSFTGWDFSWLTGRMTEDSPPWDYVGLVRTHLENAHSLLDMGTGDGEFLATLAPLPADTHATESYMPNLPIAQKRLSPLGVMVHHIRHDANLPFENQSFDLLINRHESYLPAEIYRLLKPNGLFITQQVGGLDNLEINQVLEDEITFPYTLHNLVTAETALDRAGLRVNQAVSVTLKTEFLDIGALVYYLKAIPWQVKEFSVETHFEKLVHLHNFIERHGSFVSTAHRFLIIAHKEGKKS